MGKPTNLSFREYYDLNGTLEPGDIERLVAMSEYFELWKEDVERALGILADADCTGNVNYDFQEVHRIIRDMCGSEVGEKLRTAIKQAIESVQADIWYMKEAHSNCHDILNFLVTENT